MKKYDVLIAGYLGLDLTPEFRKTKSKEDIHALLKPGSLTEIDGLQLSLGGLVANTGLAMKKFNKNIYLNGLTGNDVIGKIIIEWFERYNIENGIKTTGEASTAFGIVIAPPGVDRIFLESPGCNNIFSTKDVDFEIMSQSRILHFGYPPLLRMFFKDSGRQLFDLFTAASKAGVVTSLDLSLLDPKSDAGKCDWAAIMEAVLPLTDIFVPSVEELLQVMMPEEYSRLLVKADNADIIDFIPMRTIRKLAERIIGLGVKILLIKMAHRGAYILTADVSSVNQKGNLHLNPDTWNLTELHCDAYVADPARFKNASGAGDTAVAAFLTAIINNESPQRSIKYACIAGRNNLYCNDLLLELDSWEKMSEEIDAGLTQADHINNLKTE